MAIEYAKSALSDTVIPVKDIPLVSTGSGANEVFIKVNKGDVATIVPGTDATAADRGKIRNVAITGGTDYGVVSTVTNLGVLEGANFEGLEKQRKVGKIRTSGNAIYRGEYGTVDATTGAFTQGTIDSTIIGVQKSLAKGANGFVVHTGNASPAVKIISIDEANKQVYFQFIASTLYSS